MSDEHWRILRFLAVGLLNTGFGYLSYTVFVLAGAPLWLAVGGSTVLAFLFNFFSYGGLVFGGAHRRMLPRFLTFYAVLGLLNFLLLRALGLVGLGPLVAQAVLLPVLAVVGYVGMRQFVFRENGQTLISGRQGVEVPLEDFKPIPIRRDEGPLGGLLFSLRTVGDLQLLTCTRFLAPLLASAEGAVLDVGCGEMPFRNLLGPKARYTGIDVPQSTDFGMRAHADILPFDGRNIPFPDASFDQVLCTEVLEHAEDPAALVAEMRRVLRPGGVLIATVPFSARVHHAPHDYHRFTNFRLASLFAGFEGVEIVERGNDLAVIANKLIVVCARLLRPRSLGGLVRLPALIVMAPLTAAALAVAHLSLFFGWGSRMDPLGYGVRARKG